MLCHWVSYVALPTTVRRRLGCNIHSAFTIWLLAVDRLATIHQPVAGHCLGERFVAVQRRSSSSKSNAYQIGALFLLQKKSFHTKSRWRMVCRVSEKPNSTGCPIC